jgi:hypothetical protein
MKRISLSKLFIFQILIFSSLLFVNGAYSQNLLINADGESESLEGWVDVDQAWGTSSEITPYDGSFFIWPSRKEIAYTQLYQDIDISNYTGLSYFHLSAWMANWDQYPHDKATLAIAIYDNAMNQIAYYFREHRNPFWGYYKIEGLIPENAVILRVYLIATRYVGTDNDAYFDDVKLEVDNQSAEYEVNLSSPNGESTLQVGNTLQLNAQTIGITESNYTWSSSYDNIATVSQDGLVTALSAGVVTIQAIGETSQAIGSYTLSCYPQENYLVFTNIKQGDALKQGTTFELNWMYDGGDSAGILELSRDDGVSWELQSGIENLTSLLFNWTIPTSELAFNNCRLKISWGDYFSISPRFSIVKEIATGLIQTANKENKISIYPNPVTDQFELKGLPKKASIGIYSIDGNLIKTIRPTNNLIDASDLPKGSYFIKINNEQVELTKLFIKN